MFQDASADEDGDGGGIEPFSTEVPSSGEPDDRPLSVDDDDDTKIYDVATAEDVERMRREYARRKMAWSSSSGNATTAGRSSRTSTSSSSVDGDGNRATPAAVRRSNSSAERSISPAADEHRVSREIREERETSIVKVRANFSNNNQ